ncbi:MAG: hypothetical protein H7839_23910 [Magnetococcus sp. YQC-5]
MACTDVSIAFSSATLRWMMSSMLGALTETRPGLQLSRRLTKQRVIFRIGQCVAPLCAGITFPNGVADPLDTSRYDRSRGA